MSQIRPGSNNNSSQFIFAKLETNSGAMTRRSQDQHFWLVIMGSTEVDFYITMVRTTTGWLALTRDISRTEHPETSQNRK